MAIYYSATTNSFYDSNIIEITQMPEDSKIVTDANYKALMDAQCDGHVITANSDGTPCAITQQCGSCSGLIHDLTIATAKKLGHVKGGGNVSIDADGVMNVDIDLSGYALDSNVVHKRGNETINGVKSFGSVIKATNGTVQVGADTGYSVTFNHNGNITSKQARGTYNIFFPDGSGTLALTSDIDGKANDNNVVHNTGIETINGVKKFNDLMYIHNNMSNKNSQMDLFTTPANSLYSHYKFVDKNYEITAYMQYAQEKTGTDFIGLFIHGKDRALHGIRLSSNKEFIPLYNNTYNLGSVFNKWANAHITYTYTNRVTTYSIAHPTDDSYFFVSGGSDFDKGATLYLGGTSAKNFTPGRFALATRKTDGSSIELAGSPDGSLTWGGKSLAINDKVVHTSGNETIAGTKTFNSLIVNSDTFKHVASNNGAHYVHTLPKFDGELLGATFVKTSNGWYRKHSDGFIEMGGFTDCANKIGSAVTTNLPIAFSNTNYTLLVQLTRGTAGGDRWGDDYMCSFTQRKMTTSFIVYSNHLTETGDKGGGFDWYACGY